MCHADEHSTGNRASTWAIELAWDYKQLQDAWGVRPQLEKLLKDSLPPAVVEVLTS